MASLLLIKELIEWAYICGLGYRMVMPNSKYIKTEIVPKLRNKRTDFAEDEAPFDVYTLDPRYSFVVYHSGLGNKPVMGVKYVERNDRSVIYSVYTENNYFELESLNPFGVLKLILVSSRTFNDIPIIEYPLNNARLGAFEIVLPILDSINTVPVKQA